MLYKDSIQLKFNLGNLNCTSITNSNTVLVFKTTYQDKEMEKP